MVLRRKANFPTLNCFIRCRLRISHHPNTFEHFCIPNSNHSNHNYKVPIAFHLGMHVKRDGPHTPCSHVKKVKNVAKGQLDKCRLKNLKNVLQNNLEPISFQVCKHFSLSNSLVLIVTKLSQRVIQDPHIHGHVVLMFQAFLPSRWVFGLVRFRNHIISRLQMLYQVVLGNVGHIAPMNLINKFHTIPCANVHPLGQPKEGQ